MEIHDCPHHWIWHIERPTDPPQENPSGQGSGSKPGARATNGVPVAEGGNKPQDPYAPKLTVR